VSKSSNVSLIYLFLLEKYWYSKSEVNKGEGQDAFMHYFTFTC